MKGFKKEIDTLLKEAKTLLEKRKYRAAVTALEKYKNFFKDVDYFLLLAEAYEKIGKDEKAEEYFEKARFLESDIKSREKIVESQKFIKNRNYAKARETLEYAISLNPFDPAAYIELHRIYKIQGLKKKSAKLLKDLILIDPFNEYGYKELIAYYYSSGNYENAEKLIEEALERIKTSSFLFECSRFFHLSGDLEKAESFIRESFTAVPDNMDYIQKLVEILVANRKYDEALEILAEAVEKFPEAPFIYQSMATICELSGDDESAEFFLRKAVAFSESFIREDSLKVLADFLLDKGKTDQAEEVLKELVSFSESSWLVLDTFLELALIYMEHHRYENIFKTAKDILKRIELTQEELLELLEILTDVLEADGKLMAVKKIGKIILKLSKNEKQLKRCYTRLSSVEEKISLEKMWKKR